MAQELEQRAGLGAGADAGAGTGGFSPPATAAAAATVTGTVPTIATAPATAVVSAERTVHAVYRSTVTVRRHPSLYMTMPGDQIRVPGEFAHRGE